VPPNKTKQKEKERENNFNRFHCSIFMYEYILLPPYSSFFTLFHVLPHPIGTHPQTGFVLFTSLSFI
jgi:hypothetical protein